MYLRIFSFLSLLLLLSTCNKKSHFSELYVYDLGMEKTPIEERISLYNNLGYAGVTLRVRSNGHLKNLDSYISLTKSNHSFSVGAVYVPYYFEDSVNATVWKKVADKLSGTETALWLIMHGKPVGDEPIKTLIAMNNYCKSKNVDLVYYPHAGTYIESLEESVEFFKKAGIIDYKTSLHLCHELRAGNKERIAEIAKTYKNHIKLVSISGANDLKVYPGGRVWDNTIKPLNKGDYDIQQYLDVLKEINYNGRIFLHTFGIKTSPDIHLQESMNKWQSLNK